MVSLRKKKILNLLTTILQRKNCSAEKDSIKENIYNIIYDNIDDIKYMVYYVSCEYKKTNNEIIDNMSLEELVYKFVTLYTNFLDNIPDKK